MIQVESVMKRKLIFQQIRQISSIPNCEVKRDHMTETLKGTEVRIPVPWGHIAGKWWGPQNVRPILGLHGWQDNCGTFDPLVQLLPKHVGFLGIDFPGHGLSSRIPKGLIYTITDYLLVIRRIAKYFCWDKVSLLGHSLGGVNTFLYSSIFPETVDLAISLDTMKPLAFPPEKYAKRQRTVMDQFLIFDEQNIKNDTPPAYTYEELIEKIHSATNSSISKESCHYLLDRAIEKASTDPKKFFFTRDSRLKAMSFAGPSQAESEELSKRITCPYMAIKSTLGSYYEEPSYYYKVIDIMKDLNPGFEFHKIEGTHHAHLNDPVELSCLVNAFLNKHYKPESINSPL